VKDLHAQGPLALTITPGRKIWLLYAIAIALSLASLLGQFVEYGLGVDGRLVHIFVRLTDVGYEQNVPTWFQSMVLLIDALALWVMGNRAATTRQSWYWRLLALAFAYLSLDEFASLHEETTTVVHHLLNYSWVPDYAWVLLAIPLVILFGLLYVPFLLALPAPTRWGFIVAGVLYVGGAAGMELIGSRIADTLGEASWPYRFESVAEELLEMLGSITLLATVARHAVRSEPLAARHQGEVTDDRHLNTAKHPLPRRRANQDSELGR
jgi:hypothetical protein